MEPSRGEGHKKMLGAWQDQHLASWSPLIKRKCNDYDGEASSYKIKGKLPYSDKLFGYSESLYNSILQKEYKFKLFNLGKKYDGSTDSFDHITDY